MSREIRLDVGRLRKARRTAQGFCRVDARLTRVGVLTYTRADGSLQRELRPADEVFRADSLASLEQAPVTDMHPSAMVGPDNVQQLSVGVTGTPRRDGRFVAAELTVQAAGVISKIDAGERREISCGYTCELERTPGVFEGQPYDAIQRKIEYNHVAIGPENWGRAGAEVALRLDGGDASTTALVSRFDDAEMSSENSGDSPAANAAPSAQEKTHMTLKINGVEIKLDERDAQLVTAELERLQNEAGQAAVLLSAAEQRADAAEERVARIDRAELEQSARVALGAEARFDGKSDAEIRAAVVAAMLPELRLDGADDAYVRGAYSAAVSLASKAAEQRKVAAAQSGNARTDSAAPDAAAQARDEMIAQRRAAALLKK